MKNSNSVWYIIGVLFGLFIGLLFGWSVFTFLFSVLTFFLYLSGVISIEVSIAIAGIVAIFSFIGAVVICIGVARRIGYSAQAIPDESERRWYQRPMIMLLIGVAGLLTVISTSYVQMQQTREATRQYDVEYQKKLIREEQKQQIDRIVADVLNGDEITIQIVTSGESGGDYTLSLDISDTLYRKKLYMFEETVELFEGSNTYDHIVSLRTIAQSYHEKIINSSNTNYGFQNEEMRVNVTLVATDQSSSPSTASGAFYVTYDASEILQTP